MVVPAKSIIKQAPNVASKKIIAAPYKLKKTDRYPLLLHSLNVGFRDTESRYAPIAAIKPVIVILNVVIMPSMVGIFAGLIAGKNGVPFIQIMKW